MKKIALLFGVGLAAAGLAVALSQPHNAASTQADQGGAAKAEKAPQSLSSPVPSVSLAERITTLSEHLTDVNDPAVAMSSNPYDYVQGNRSYDALVALGTPALPLLKQRIEASPESGLEEYLLAIAAEEIAKVNLKTFPGLGWTTANEWPRAWNRYLRSVPRRVASIRDSSTSADERITELVKLGTPAIPFLMDAIAAGNHDELLPALRSLVAGTNELASASSIPLDRAWVQTNSDLYTGLRDLVVEAQSGSEEE